MAVPATRLLLAASTAVFLLQGCGAPRGDTVLTQGSSPRDTTFVRPLYGPTWTLVRLRGAPAPAGADDRPATLIFFSGAQRTAAGFAGCNRWTSQYTITLPDSIGFTPPTATKMACTQGMELERDFLAVIQGASRITRRDSVLVLRTATGDSAIFVARDE